MEPGWFVPEGNDLPPSLQRAFLLLLVDDLQDFTLVTPPPWHGGDWMSRAPHTGVRLVSVFTILNLKFGWLSVVERVMDGYGLSSKLHPAVCSKS